jgi:hypothetical protein
VADRVRPASEPLHVDEVAGGYNFDRFTAQRVIGQGLFDDTARPQPVLAGPACVLIGFAGWGSRGGIGQRGLRLLPARGPFNQSSRHNL